ncbi:MAG: TetR/AcrR family transcriptional regulator [Mycobacterium sp.]
MSPVGGRPKLDPDPRMRAAILAAALEVVREDGVRGLGIAQVLGRAQLGTRAFYRHFDSKDQLIAAVFLEMAHAEVKRLKKKMAGTDPVRAVAAWIDGRLDLAFNTRIQSDLRRMSLEAQSQMFAAPELIAPAYEEILRPLVDEVGRGAELGMFVDVDPTTEARAIHGVVWTNVEGQWSTRDRDHREIRDRVQRFCLRGLGVATNVIAEVVPKRSG